MLRNAHKHPLCTWRCDLKDALKAPTGCAPKPAFFQPAATNHCVGANLDKMSDGALVRPAHGSGTGAGSIGLDPRHQRIHTMTPTASDLCNMVTGAVSSACPDLAERLRDHPFNHIAHKCYHTYWRKACQKGEIDWTTTSKKVDWHCDTTYTAGGAPMRNNSQVPDTIVAIFTFGADKSLFFRKCRQGGEHDQKTLLHFLQKHGSLFIIDCRDEKPDAKGWRWKHKSEMIGKGGITFSLVFRCVQATAVVQPNGAILQPLTTTRRLEKFQKADGIFETEDYKISREDLEARMQAFFQKYNPK